MTAKREEQRLALWDKWLLIKGSAQDTLRLSIDVMFEGLKEAACGQLAADAARFARLGNNDEAVYDQLVGLMAVYRRVIVLSGEITGGSPTVLALLKGVCEVLGSRLRQFDDMASNNGKGAENPVAEEKCGIINGAVKYAARKIDDQAELFISRLKEAYPTVWASLCAAIINDPSDAMPQGEVGAEPLLKKECFSDIYSHYKESLAFCLAGLDDLHARKTAQCYTELIEGEWEQLGNIIRVQVLALEAAAGDNSEIQRILDIMREAYQHLGPFIDGLQKLLHSRGSASAESPVLCCGQDEFMQLLESALITSRTSADNVECRAFMVSLSVEAAAILDDLKIEFMKAAYGLQRMISEELLLAEEIAEVFTRARAIMPEITGLTPVLEEKEAGIQRDILKGIGETIEIKIESLMDSIRTFNTDSVNVFKAFSSENPDIPEDERHAACAAVRDTWMASPPVDFSAVEEFFRGCWESEAFLACRQRVDKQINAYREKIAKSVFRFKKEVLLYEICTFEEILVHSVSRLRESAWEEMAGAAALLDDTFAKLEILLKKNNIAMIRPVAHEPFNAQEHEVLVAEKQEGFAKGEIIKVLNAGYRQKDQIILRANVVAAR